MTDLWPEDALESKNVKIVGADHANWHIKDVERSLRFYHGILGLAVFGLEEHCRGEHSFISVRVSPGFTLHLRPDPGSEPHARSDDHLALVVEGIGSAALQVRLENAGLEIERSSTQPLGARGHGPALYVRDPDGYLIELKLYGA